VASSVPCMCARVKRRKEDDRCKACVKSIRLALFLIVGRDVCLLCFVLRESMIASQLILSNHSLSN
jgi:hypothetical protein